MEFWITNCIIAGIFPDTCKSSNVIPTHKKYGKQLKNYYLPVSLENWYLTIYWNILVHGNQLMQIYQVLDLQFFCLSVTEEHTTCFHHLITAPAWQLEQNVWHERLVFKLRSMGISGSLCVYTIAMKSFVTGRYQKSLLNGKSLIGQVLKQGFYRASFWAHCVSGPIKAGLRSLFLIDSQTLLLTSKTLLCKLLHLKACSIYYWWNLHSSFTKRKTGKNE